MDQDMGLDNMMKTLLNVVDSLSAKLPSMTAEATAAADPETSAMLSNLQSMMKMNIARLKSMINTPTGNAMADPAKTARLQMSASKWALANHMTDNGFPTDPGTLTVQYSAGGKHHSVDLIVRPRSAWELHTHDFSRDPDMRGGQLFTDIYPTLAKIASSTTFIDAKTGEEKGNLQYSPDKGLVNRDNGEVVAIDKAAIAKILLGPAATARDLSSISGIRDSLQKDPQKWAKTKHLFPSSSD
jgi:hypothetical protein